MSNFRTLFSGRHFWLATTALTLVSVSAHAQEAQKSDDSLRLKAVKVTALMREQGLQDVPVSVNVIDGEAIDNYNFETFDDLDRTVPNLVISDTPGNNEIYVRGIGTQSGNLAFEQSVSMFVDGMYGGRARLFQVPFLDIERIEVLRGPQGALVGKNTSAGAISVVTRKPTDEVELSVTGEYEFEYEGRSLTGIASGPLTDRLKARLAVKTSDKGGFVYNQTKNQDEPKGELFAARLTSVFDASDNVRFTGKIDYAKNKLTGTPFETVAIGQSPDYIKESDNVLIPERDRTESLIGLLETEIDIGDHLLKLITAYGDLESTNFVDASFTAAPSLAATFEDNYTQFSQEARLVSPTGGLFEYVVGALYLDQDVDIQRKTLFNFGPFAGNDVRDFDQESQVTSVFGQLTWNMSDSLRAIGSVRYTSEEKSATLDRATVGIVPPSSLISNLTGDRTEDQFDPSATLQWDATPDIMLYGTYSKGSKGGGFAGASSSATPANFEFEPEEAESFEVGTKTTLLDGRANLNVALFTTEYKQLQVSQFNGISFDFGNAASAKTKGVEVEGTAQVAEGVRLNGSVAYLDAKYDSYPGGACVAPDNIIPGCVDDISGVTLVNAPEWSGSLSVDAERDLTNNLVWKGNLGMTFRSSYFTHPTLFEDSKQGAHAKLDLRLALANRANTWELALVGKNLTDERTIGQAFETPFSAPPGSTPDHTQVTVLPEIPRTVAIQLTFRN